MRRFVRMLVTSAATVMAAGPFTAVLAADAASGKGAVVVNAPPGEKGSVIVNAPPRDKPGATPVDEKKSNRAMQKRPNPRGKTCVGPNCPAVVVNTPPSERKAVEVNAAPANQPATLPPHTSKPHTSKPKPKPKQGD